MGASNVKWVRIGDYIEQCDERNTAGNNYPVIGINRDKTFMPTVANLDGVDIAKYPNIKLSQKDCLYLVVCRQDVTFVFVLDYTTMNNRL